MSPDLRALFLQVHGDLLTSDYWNRIKNKLIKGDIELVIPYFRHPYQSGDKKQKTEDRVMEACRYGFNPYFSPVFCLIRPCSPVSFCLCPPAAGEIRTRCI